MTRPSPATLCLAMLLGGLAACGAKTGLEQPEACTADEDCPPAEDFCGRLSVCVRGSCGLGDTRDCADALVCTVDRCDEAADACVHDVRDRDGDSFTDGSCGGPDCDDHDPSIHPGATELCSGGRDEECDALIDCSDPDCARDPRCLMCMPEVCDNRRDDDCDTMVDCDDADCTTFPACCDPRETLCDDSRDDDCDGAIDCLDSDCAAAPTCCDARPEVCNGLDEDCDGIADDGVPCFFLDGARIAAITSTACGAAWYSYDDPDPQSASPTPDIRQSSKVVVAVQTGPTCGGSTLAVIADQVDDGTGGGLDGTFDITPRTGVGVLVSDDDAGRTPECRYDAATGRASCFWTWQPCCTDGVLLGTFATDFCVTVTLSARSGVDELLVHDGASRRIPRPFGTAFEICGVTIPAAP